jgi:transcriptional repressor NrdR
VKCPFCANAESKVVDTRASATGDVIRRRRECDKCSGRFTSYERVEDIFPAVVKKDGRREPYDRMKLLGGLRKACSKRPVPEEKIEAAVAEIERFLIEQDAKEVSGKVLGEKVMEQLHELDEIAYVRFASVYRSFRDIEEFRAEVDKIAQARSPSSSNPPVPMSDRAPAPSGHAKESS